MSVMEKDKDSLYLDVSENVPVIRSTSPPPDVCPTPALSPYPSTDRSFSAASSEFSFSAQSSTSRSSTSSAGRRAGYIRTHGTEFADSARARESVSRLGSIAHLQYYFARTGLLDGKGAQLARPKDLKKAKESKTEPLSPPGGIITESPSDEEQDSWEDYDGPMLPPTVSTYKHPNFNVSSPPNMKSLRHDLRKSIAATWKTLDSTRKDDAAMKEEDEALEKRATPQTPESSSPAKPSDDHSNSTSKEQSSHKSEFTYVPELPMEVARQTLWELQGMDILDNVTLAIRAARIYYTSHPEPQRLARIKPERQIREECLTVLETLKTMAARTFKGGLRANERRIIEDWVSGVDELLQEEARQERLECEKRRSWTWLTGQWNGSEYSRDWSFLDSFRMDEDHLPSWLPATESDHLPTEFLRKLQDGLYLIRLHNASVRLSKRPFGEIKRYHSDTNKPYRCAENLRFWIKAAELRWEVKLEIDVMGVVHGNDDEAWKKFDTAIFKWSQAVRKELARDLFTSPEEEEELKPKMPKEPPETETKVETPEK